MDRREQLIEIFNDTLDYINESDELKKSVDESKKETKFYRSGTYLDLSNNPIYEPDIEINELKSFETVFELRKKYKDLKIGVLNFASATNPGGGVTKGSSAQEESLCRCSTLYPLLNNNFLYKNYYWPNRIDGDNLHTDDLIYTPNVLIIKSDEAYPKRLDKKDFITVDIISAAAPNLRGVVANEYNPESSKVKSVTDEELYQIHLSRAKHILNIAAAHQNKIIVLGAFGCGAFRNNPYVVAKAYKEALKEYAKYFVKVIFAIYHRDFEIENYQAFKETF